MTDAIIDRTKKNKGLHKKISYIIKRQLAKCGIAVEPSDEKKVFKLEEALARKDNGDFIPTEDLVWVPVTGLLPQEFTYETWDEANVARIEMQKKDNNFYYRIAK